MPEITYREAIRQALREEMTRDDRVYIMGEDIGAYGGSYAATRRVLCGGGADRVNETPTPRGGRPRSARLRRLPITVKCAPA